eukprot:1919849-Prymnesium_polylepis.1
MAARVIQLWPEPLTRDREEADAALPRRPPGSELTPPPKVVDVRERAAYGRCAMDFRMRCERSGADRGSPRVTWRAGPVDLIPSRAGRR